MRFFAITGPHIVCCESFYLRDLVPRVGAGGEYRLLPADTAAPVTAEEAADALNAVLNGFLLAPIVLWRTASRSTPAAVHRVCPAFISGGRPLHVLATVLRGDSPIPVSFDFTEKAFRPDAAGLPGSALFNTAAFVRWLKGAGLSPDVQETAGLVPRDLADHPIAVQSYTTDNIDQALRYRARLAGTTVEQARVDLGIDALEE